MNKADILDIDEWLKTKDIRKCIKKISDMANKVRYAGNCNDCDGVGYDCGCMDTNCGTWACYRIIEIIRGED